MTLPSEGTRELARRIFAEEAGGDDAEAWIEVTDSVCAKLAGELLELIGPGGVDALLRRAVRLTRRDHPVLDGVRIVRDPDCRLQGLRDCLVGRDEEEIKSVVAGIVAHLVGLLSGFLGDDLALRPIRRIWPRTVDGVAQPDPTGISP